MWHVNGMTSLCVPFVCVLTPHFTCEMYRNKCRMWNVNILHLKCLPHEPACSAGVVMASHFTCEMYINKCHMWNVKSRHTYKWLLYMCDMTFSEAILVIAFKHVQCISVCCSVLQCVAVCCSVLRCVAVCCSRYDSYTSLVYAMWLLHHMRDMHHSYVMQHTATHCNTLQHTATHCSTLQHTATQYPDMHYSHLIFFPMWFL